VGLFSLQVFFFFLAILKSFKQGQNNTGKYVQWENISYKIKKNDSYHWVDFIISHRSLGSIQHC
jgi:hypothetical protein